jgi:hypothetical protein
VRCLIEPPDTGIWKELGVCSGPDEQLSATSEALQEVEGPLAQDVYRVVKSIQEIYMSGSKNSSPESLALNSTSTPESCEAIVKSDDVTRNDVEFMYITFWTTYSYLHSKNYSV